LSALVCNIGGVASPWLVQLCVVGKLECVGLSVSIECCRTMAGKTTNTTSVQTTNRCKATNTTSVFTTTRCRTIVEKTTNTTSVQNTHRCKATNSTSVQSTNRCKALTVGNLSQPSNAISLCHVTQRYITRPRLGHLCDVKCVSCAEDVNISGLGIISINPNATSSTACSVNFMLVVEGVNKTFSINKYISIH